MRLVSVDLHVHPPDHVDPSVFDKSIGLLICQKQRDQRGREGGHVGRPKPISYPSYCLQNAGLQSNLRFICEVL